MLIGGILCGLCSDRIGRKPCLVASLSVNGFAGLMSAAVGQDMTWLILLRGVAGIGIGGSVPSIFTMMTEYVPSDRRGWYLTLIAWHWMVGSILTAGLAWLVLSKAGNSDSPVDELARWQIFVALCSIPAFIACGLVVGLLPETP